MKTIIIPYKRQFDYFNNRLELRTMTHLFTVVQFHSSYFEFISILWSFVHSQWFMTMIIDQSFFIYFPFPSLFTHFQSFWKHLLLYLCYNSCGYTTKDCLDSLFAVRITFQDGCKAEPLIHKSVSNLYYYPNLRPLTRSLYTINPV